MASAKAAGAKVKWQSAVGGDGYMGISLHSRNHQGDGLSAMVDWINCQGKFNHVRVGLSDTLNRFSYARDCSVSLKAAYRAVAEKGDEWLSENLNILDRLTMPHDLVRWSHWLDTHTAEVERNRALFNQAYEEIPEFRASVDADIFAFLARTNSDHSLDNIDRCRQYLIEELAVYSVIFRERPATTVYPGKQLNCFAYMREEKPVDLPTAIGNTKFIRLGIHGLDKPPVQPPPADTRGTRHLALTS